jgi:hypothetical protein
MCEGGADGAFGACKRLHEDRDPSLGQVPSGARHDKRSAPADMMAGMRPDRRWVLAVFLTFSFAVGAAEPAGGAKKSAPGKGKLEVPKIDLSGMAAIPTGEGLQAKKEDPNPMVPRAGDGDLKFQVITVAHARQFSRTGKGYAPVGGLLKTVALEGTPPATPKFTTFVRVRATRETDAAIEVALLDPSGDTAMSGTGHIRFKKYGTGADADWTIDWDPTPCPRGGTYQVLVRVGGQPMGTWPLEVVAEKR